MELNQIKDELRNAIVFIQQSLDASYFRGADEERHVQTIRAIYEAINLIDEQIN